MKLVKILVSLFILLITATIIAVSATYFPPDFNRGFLAGKEALFQGFFPYGLYAHVFSAPLLIVLATILIFFRLEYRFPKTHRLLGKMVVIIGLLLFIPSSFILSAFALGGIRGILIFGMLSLLTTISLVLAWRFARRKEIARHRKWMLRFYIFLLSAIFLRLNKFIFGYYFDRYGIEIYLLSALLSWLPQWLVLELVFAVNKLNIKDFSRK